MGCKAFALLLLLAGLTAAEAAVKAGPNVMGSHHRLKTPSGGGPLAGLPTPNGAYSFRKLIPAYGGSAARLLRASDGGSQDIGFTGNDFNTVAATTFCNATTCSVSIMWDQSGHGLNIAVGVFEPPLSFSCLGVNPCLHMTSANHTLQTADFTTATGKISFSVVSRRVAGTGGCWAISAGGNGTLAYNSTAAYKLAGAAGQILAPQTENTWHAVSAVINGVSSSVTVDGTTTTGNTTGGASAQPIYVVGAASTTCDEIEAIFWDNYALTAPEAAALSTNQHAYWGF